MGIKIVRPRGKLYIFANVVILTFFIGMISFAVWSSFSYWEEFKDDIIAIPFVLAGVLIGTYLVIERIVDIIRYKVIISDDKIISLTNKMPFNKLQKRVSLTYNGLIRIQYVLGFKRAQIVSKIVFTYDTGKQTYINVWKFSDRQVETILQEIILHSECNTNKSIERLPDMIQEGFKREI